MRVVRKSELAHCASHNSGTTGMKLRGFRSRVTSPILRHLPDLQSLWHVVVSLAFVDGSSAFGLCVVYVFLFAHYSY